MSYSDDLTLSLSQSLISLTPRLISSPPETPDSTVGTLARVPSNEVVEDRISLLRATLSSITSSKRPPTLEKLAHLVDEVFPPFQGMSSVPLTAQVESIELLVLAQLTIAAYGAALGTVVSEGKALGKEDEYWSKMEGDRWQLSMFLVQTTPFRLFSAAATSFERLRQLRTHAPTFSMHSLKDLRRALPPSLLLTSMFPHLSATLSEKVEDPFSISSSSSSATSRQLRRLLLLTLSPLVLTGQEVARKREAIRKARGDLAEKIGVLAAWHSDKEGLRGLLSLSPASATIEALQAGTYSTLRLLDSALSPSPTMPALPPSTPSNLAHSLKHLLAFAIPSHSRSTNASLEELSRPSTITRTWPAVVSVPLGTLIFARTIYNSRETIYGWITAARETASGFLVDWVIEPVSNILSTIRNGDDGMALMPKESLKSDLDSLERMVLEFGKDQYKLGPDELKELGEQVRAGDLTSVLRVWEKDIKSPIRSAVTGSLIRTLLIQVQKVKVDTLVMVNGIEKMLHSQQLTFAFVGVAPSMLILVGIGQWLRGLLSRDGGKANKRDVRKRCWATMRHLDALVSALPGDEPIGAQSQGFLLLELDALPRGLLTKKVPSIQGESSGHMLETDRGKMNVNRSRWNVTRPWIIEFPSAFAGIRHVNFLSSKIKV